MRYRCTKCNGIINITDDNIKVTSKKMRLAPTPNKYKQAYTYLIPRYHHEDCYA